MKKLILALLITCSTSLFAQNAVHYAFDTNGPLGECLFPQDSKGNVTYSGIVEADGSASVIMDALLDYISSQKVRLGFEQKELTKSPKSVAYKIKCPIGKQLREITVMGSPVFTAMKDASEISFTCLLEVIDGKFKYTLNDFMTKRNTLKGEAKNDGFPNLIHWQRVNSLKKERAAYLAKHNPEKRSTRECLYDYDSQIEFEQNLYVSEHKKVSEFIDGLKSFSLEKKDMFGSDVIADNSEESNDIEELDLSAFHGNLLAKGNNVFVSGSALYEMAGAGEIVKQITVDSLWNVVFYPEQAHFIIEYHVNTVGSDKAHIVVRSRDGSISYTSPTRSTSESFEDNRGTASTLYNILHSKAKRIWEGKGDKDLDKFVIAE